MTGRNRWAGGKNSRHRGMSVGRRNRRKLTQKVDAGGVGEKRMWRGRTGLRGGGWKRERGGGEMGGRGHCLCY